MSDKTGIEWTDATWNVVIGCDKVSPGCDHCYAIRTAHRMQAHPNPKVVAPYAGTEAGGEWTGRVNLVSDRLSMPLRWKDPRRIFVNAQSDLFHDSVPDTFIAEVFGVMSLASQHTFQVLTKRHGRMRSLLSSPNVTGFGHSFEAMVRNVHHNFRNNFRLIQAPNAESIEWPLPNVWLGVSTENQQWADIRIPALLETPAAVRFISAEPLLGPIDLFGNADKPGPGILRSGVQLHPGGPDGPAEYDYDDQVGIDWVIVGGESGGAARPIHPDWARSLRDQCQAADVAYLFKQWGEWAVDFRRGTHLLQTTGQLITRESGTTTNPYGHDSGVQDLVDRGHPGWVRVRRAGKKAAGRELDGQTWDQYPEVSCV